MNDTIQQVLVSILKHSKDGDAILSTSVLMTEVLEELGVLVSTDQTWTLTRDQRISVALKAISAGIEPETVVMSMTWKDFEGLIAQVLSENSYDCTESFRRRGNKLEEGMEIDVIGVRGNSILVIDAKMWGVRKYKASALIEAVKKQIVRTERLADQLDKLTKRIPNLKPQRYELYPIMVTWLVEDVKLHEGVPVVPVFKLNSFLQELAHFQDMVIAVEGILESTMEQTKL
ncbi:MAG: hypothetical protein ACXAEF_10020 [Candidatus Thorarchaeota archaeon]|jgi:hypothetical protein